MNTVKKKKSLIGKIEVKYIGYLLLRNKLSPSIRLKTTHVYYLMFSLGHNISISSVQSLSCVRLFANP